MREEGRAPGDNQALVRAALPNVGDVLVGKYRIEKVVGEGGMGVVFAARHEALDQLVAVKVLLADAAKGEGVIERFVREAQAAARLQSEHVARVFDAGSLENNTPFLVMEFLDGCDLEELLKLNGTLPISDACDYIVQALAAMSQAHAVGIIHRDLKPANLFLTVRPDGSNIIKILDFGISKQTASTGREKALTGRAVLGSPAYMPPEQLRNAKGVDLRADIWSLGIVLYEMLTGVAPFDGEGVGEIFAAILEKNPASILARRPEVPPELEAVVFKALQRNPDDRYQSVAEFAEALEPFCSAKWAPLIETICLTLERSMRMRTMKTPPEMRLMAQKAMAAAKSVRPGALTDDPSSPASAKVAFTRTDQHLPPPSVRAAIGVETLSETKKRSRAWILVAAAGLVIVGGAAFLMRGYLRPHAAAPLVSAAPEEPAPANDAVVMTPTLTTPSGAGAPTSVAADSADAGAKPIASAAAKPGSRRPSGGTRPKATPTTAGSATGRPKFLNQRD